MAIAVTAACADAPTAVAPTDSDAKIGVSGEASFVVGPLSTSSSRAVATIGAAGGTITAGGVTLSVPEGALTKDVTITVEVPVGMPLLAEFAPHGLQFAKPATVSFGLGGVDTEGLELEGAYFTGFTVTGEIEVEETFELEIEDGIASFDISHFSGYCVVGNRCDQSCRE